MKNITTVSGHKFILQVIYRSLVLYLQYLKQINNAANMIQKKLEQESKNKQLIKLMNLEKSLVYFTTSLKTNELMLERIQRHRIVQLDDELEDLFEDIVIETPAGPRDGERLQRHPERHDGRLRVGHIEQPEHRHEVPDLHDHHHHDPGTRHRLLRHEKDILRILEILAESEESVGKLYQSFSSLLKKLSDHYLSVAEEIENIAKQEFDHRDLLLKDRARLASKIR